MAPPAPAKAAISEETNTSFSRMCDYDPSKAVVAVNSLRMVAYAEIAGQGYHSISNGLLLDRGRLARMATSADMAEWSSCSRFALIA